MEFGLCTSHFPATRCASVHSVLPAAVWGLGTSPVGRRTVYKESELTRLRPVGEHSRISSFGSAALAGVL